MAKPRLHRQGNRVIRRRLDATAVIDLPSDPKARSVPNSTTHAKYFVLIVLVLMLIGAGLLMLPFATEGDRKTSLIDALFVATSASAVTGLTPLDTQLHWSFFGELVILLLIQVGGFGFMAGTSIALISIGRGSSLRDSLMMQDGSPAMSLNEVTSLSRRIITFMLKTEAVGAIVLFFHFIQEENLANAIWYSVFHAISAFCNAGFDLFGHFASVAEYPSSPILLVTMAMLTQFGALSYMVMDDLYVKRRWRTLTLDSKLVLLIHVLLVFLGTAVFLTVEWNGAMDGIDARWKPLNALFQSIVARTSGFASIDWSAAHASTMFSWTGLMMVGGAAGSTAGGIKLATLGVITMTVLSQVQGKSEPQAFGRRLTTTTIYRAVTMISLFVTAIFVLTMLLLLVEDVFYGREYTLIVTMFEVTSGLATVGLTAGLTPELSAAGKVIVMIAMLIGRIGPITLMFALQKKHNPTRYRFPESNIRIG